MKKILTTITFLLSFAFCPIFSMEQAQENCLITSPKYSDDWWNQLSEHAELYLKVNYRTCKNPKETPFIFQFWLNWYKNELNAAIDNPNIHYYEDSQGCPCCGDWRYTLYKPVSETNYGLTKLLLDYNADPNKKDKHPKQLYDDKKNILFTATTVKMAQLLIKYGAQLELAEHNDSLLHEVMGKPSLNAQLIPFYIEKGIDPNAYNDLNRTPLHSLILIDVARNYDNNIDTLKEKLHALLKQAHINIPTDINIELFNQPLTALDLVICGLADKPTSPALQEIKKILEKNGAKTFIELQLLEQDTMI